MPNDPNYPQFLPPNYNPASDPNSWMNLGYSSGDLTNAGLETQPLPNLGADPFEQLARERANAANPALQLNQQNVGQDDAAQAQMLQYLHQLAQGDPNSAAQQQLRASTQQARAAASSGATRMQGGAGRALRAGRRAQEGIQQRYVGQQQLLQLQQQRQAQQLLAQLYAQMHGQDVGMAGQVAGLQLQNTALGDQNQQFYAGANNAGFINRLQQGQDFTRAQNNMDLESAQLDRANLQRWTGAAGTAAGTLASMLGGQNNAHANGGYGGSGPGGGYMGTSGGPQRGNGGSQDMGGGSAWEDESGNWHAGGYGGG